MLFIILVLSYDDKELLVSLYDALNSKMYTVAYRILGNPNDAEDALQEAFIRMMKYAETIKAKPCPERAPYCVMIVKSV